MANDFEWDDVKAATNLVKHGISFPTASEVFLDPARTEIAVGPADYGEARWIAFGRVRDTLLAVVFTSRGTARRIISARRASREERRRYGHGSYEP